MRQGIDVASFQHPNDAAIDYAACVASGVTWVAVKITEGTSYVNPYAADDCAGFLGVGIDVVPYHFARPGSVTAAQQAAFFASSCPAPIDPTHGALDYEQSDGAEWRELATWALAFHAQCAVDLLYVNRTWQRALASAGLVWPGRLWIAAPSESVFPAEATVWQYGTTTVAGVAAQCDVDQILDNQPGDDMLDDQDKQWLSDKIGAIEGDSRAEIELKISDVRADLAALSAKIDALHPSPGGALNITLTGTGTPA